MARLARGEEGTVIGVPDRVCCFDGNPAAPGSLWFDYAGRARYVCSGHVAVSVADRNRCLIRGVVPSKTLTGREAVEAVSRDAREMDRAWDEYYRRESRITDEDP